MRNLPFNFAAVQCSSALTQQCVNPKEMKGKSSVADEGLKRTRQHLFFCKNGYDPLYLEAHYFFDKITLILDHRSQKKNQANINIRIQFQSDDYNTYVKFRYQTDSGSNENIAFAYNGDHHHAQTIFLTTIIGLDVGDSVSTYFPVTQQLKFQLLMSQPCLFICLIKGYTISNHIVRK